MGRINGYVDQATLSPVVPLTLLSESHKEITIQTVVDTGYNGELILPESIIFIKTIEYK